MKWEIEHGFEEKADDGKTITHVIAHDAEYCYLCAFCEDIKKRARKIIPRRRMQEL